MNEVFEYLLNLAADYTGLRSLPDTLNLNCGENEVKLGIKGRYQTQPHTCGAVAGFMVLHYFKPRIKVDSFFHITNCTRKDGTSTFKLIRALRHYGLRVERYKSMTFADFAAAIDMDKPVIVDIKTADPLISHWVVVYGYGCRPNRLFLAGTGLPLISRKEYRWSDFRKNWASKGEALVCGRRIRKTKSSAKSLIK